MVPAAPVPLPMTAASLMEKNTDPPRGGGGVGTEREDIASDASNGGSDCKRRAGKHLPDDKAGGACDGKVGCPITGFTVVVVWAFWAEVRNAVSTPPDAQLVALLSQAPPPSLPVVFCDGSLVYVAA